MSYILDALRRAESERERERNRVPGLHAQVEAPADGDQVPRAGPGSRLWIGAALLAGVALVLAWWLGRAGGSDPRPEAGKLAGSQAAPAAVTSAVSVRPDLSAPAVVVPTSAGAVVTAPPPPLPPPAPAQAQAPTRPAQPVVTPAPAHAPAAVPAQVPAPVPAPTLARPARAGPPERGGEAAADAPRPIVLADLTAEQRAALPPLAIGGAVYSEQAASRFVLINGQVVREGEAAAPGVTLERIAPKSAVLRWRDLRIEVPY